MASLEDELNKKEAENAHLKEKLKETVAKAQHNITTLTEKNQLLRNKLENLLTPPLIHAFFLGEAQDTSQNPLIEGEQKPENKQYVILHRGERLLVNANAELQMDQLIQEQKLVVGQYVLVNAETPNILHIGEYPTQGSVGRIHEILSEQEYIVEMHHDEKVVAIKGHHAPNQMRVGDEVLFNHGIILSQIARTERKRTLEVLPVDKTFENIGGLDSVKKALLPLFQDRIAYPEILAQYKRNMPKGILLHGPPGCGKTTIAKAVIHELNQSFDALFKHNYELVQLYKGVQEKNVQALTQARALQKSYTDMFGPVQELEFLQELLRVRKIDYAHIQDEEKRLERLLTQKQKAICMYANPGKALNKWFGESERIVRELFTELRDSAREYGFAAVILDEPESILRTRGTSVGTQAYDSIVTEFCRELDGMVPNSNIMVFFLTNRHDLIDPAILRHGRIDLKFHVKRPETPEEAKQIFSVYLNEKIPLDIHEIKKYGSKEKTCEALIDLAVQELFAENKNTQIAEFVLETGEREPMYYKHLLSGALIESVVQRAEDYAIERLIAHQKGKSSDARYLCGEDLVRAARSIYEEEKFVPKGTNQEEWGRTLGESRKIVPRTQKQREKGGRNYM